MELEAEMRADEEKFLEAKRRKQERLTLMHVKLEGMREMDAFTKSASQLPASVEPLPPLVQKRMVRPVVILKAPYTWPHFPKTGSETAETPETLKRRRPLSDKWQPFFHFIETKGGATVEEMDAFAVSCMKIEKKLAREQLRYYNREQFVRLDVGTRKYHLTDLGRSIYDPAKGEIVGDAANSKDLDFQAKASSDSTDVSDLV